MDEKRVFLQFLLLEYGLSSNEEYILLLDEIQYLPDPNRLLKSLYDDTTLPWKIIATGSRYI